MGVDRLVAARETALCKWRRRAAELEDQESELHMAATAEVRGVIAQKRILLFREMLLEAGFPSAHELCELMAKGFPIVGEMVPSRVFAAKVGDPVVGTSDLDRHASELQGACLAAVGPSKDSDLDAAVYEITRTEVERGWLSGPFTPSQLSEKYGSWIGAKRFGIKEGNEIRAIDDYTAFGQNRVS